MNTHCSIVSNLNGHPNLIGYVDSTISLLDGGVHEVLLLMPYHKVTLLQIMNDRLNSGKEHIFNAPTARYEFLASELVKPALNWEKRCWLYN